MKRIYAFIEIRLVAIVILAMSVSFLYSQSKHDTNITITAPDSDLIKRDTLVRSHEDSILIENLTLQVHELKLNEILIRNEYDKSFKADSIKQAEKKQQIDSLRNLTPGIPLVVEKDTLFSLYAKRGGITARQRVESIEKAILSLGKKLTTQIDTLSIFDSEHTTDIMSGDKVIITITDQDGLWQNMSRQELAKEYESIISKKIDDLQVQYGLSMKIKSIGLSILIIILQVILIYLTNRLFKKLHRRIVRLVQKKLKPIAIKNYEFLNARKQGKILFFVSNAIRLLVILIQLLISVPILFSIFPETKELAYTILSYIWQPLKDILLSIGKYIPDLFKILVIIYCFRYINKGLRYIAKEIATGKLRLTGFYDDWAYPTYYILRFLLYSFMFIMIWPLLPNSHSAIFQGISVFVGLVISLGSTTVIGNLMAGMVLTYMRSFKIGDQIKMNDIVGEVIEKTPFVTRIRTSKNEIVTVPNSTIMSAQTVNYTMSAKIQGIIIHAEINVGYKVEKDQVRALLLEAAAETKGINSYPNPFVIITKLDDFFCNYQINGYTKETNSLSGLYSRLYENIMDKFNEAGIELTSPYFSVQRDGKEIMIPPKYKADTNMPK